MSVCRCPFAHFVFVEAGMNNDRSILDRTRSFCRHDHSLGSPNRSDTVEGIGTPLNMLPTERLHIDAIALIIAIEFAVTVKSISSILNRMTSRPTHFNTKYESQFEFCLRLWNTTDSTQSLPLFSLLGKPWSAFGLASSVHTGEIANGLIHLASSPS